MSAPELDPTHKLVGLCLKISPAAITTLVKYQQEQFPGQGQMSPGEVLAHPSVQEFIPITMPELNLPFDEDRDGHISNFLIFLNKAERDWLIRLRETDWQQVDAAREATELFHDGFIAKISGRVMYALVKGSMLLQGCEPPTDLNKKMAGARKAADSIRKLTRSNTLSANVPPIPRPQTPSSERGA